MMTEGEVAEGEEGVEEGEEGGRLDIIGDRPMTEPKTITVWMIQQPVSGETLKANY